MMAASAPAFAVETQEAVANLAYMDMEHASAEQQEKILKAREEIIFSQSWVADGVQGFVYDENGNVVEEVPQFSSLFPSDWEIPVFDISEGVVQQNSSKSQVLSDEQELAIIFLEDKGTVLLSHEIIRLTRQNRPHIHCPALPSPSRQTAAAPFGLIGSLLFAVRSSAFRAGARRRLSGGDPPTSQRVRRGTRSAPGPFR